MMEGGKFHRLNGVARQTYCFGLLAGVVSGTASPFRQYPI